MILIHHMLDVARRRLNVIGADASLREVATALFESDKPLVVICNPEEKSLGVIGRTDVLRALSLYGEGAARVTAASVMTQAVVSCTPNQPLQAVWSMMEETTHQCIPILDQSGKPIGIAHIHDVARLLFDELSTEELALQNYVQSIGYR